MTDMTITASDFYSVLDTSTLSRLLVTMESGVELVEDELISRFGNKLPTPHFDVFKVDGDFVVYGIDCIGEYDVIATEADYDDALEIALSFED